MRKDIYVKCTNARYVKEESFFFIYLKSPVPQKDGIDNVTKYLCLCSLTVILWNYHQNTISCRTFFDQKKEHRISLSERTFISAKENLNFPFSKTYNLWQSGTLNQNKYFVSLFSVCCVFVSMLFMFNEDCNLKWVFVSSLVYCISHKKLSHSDQ